MKNSHVMNEAKLHNSRTIPYHTPNSMSVSYTQVIRSTHRCAYNRKFGCNLLQSHSEFYFDFTRLRLAVQCIQWNPIVHMMTVRSSFFLSPNPVNSMSVSYRLIIILIIIYRNFHADYSASVWLRSSEFLDEWSVVTVREE